MLRDATWRRLGVMDKAKQTNEPTKCVLSAAIKARLDPNGPTEYGPDDYEVRLLPTGVVRIVKLGKNGGPNTIVGFVPLHHIDYLK
jgi:hypothetical protein